MQARSLTVGSSARLLSFAAIVLAALAGSGCYGTEPMDYIGVIYTGGTWASMEPSASGGEQAGRLAERAAYIEQCRQSIELKRQSANEAEAAHSTGADDSAEAANGSGSVKAEGPAWPGPQTPDYCLLVDRGSFCGNACDSLLVQAIYTAQAMELQQYHAVNLGVGELSLAGSQLKQVLAAFERTAVVSANVEFDQTTQPESAARLKRIVKPYHRVKLGDCRFFITGIVSLNHPQALQAQSLGYLVGDPLEKLKSVVRQARSQEFIVVLADGMTGSDAELLLRRHSELPISVVVGVLDDWSMPLDVVTHGSLDMVYLDCGLDSERSIGRADLIFMGSGSIVVQDLAHDILTADNPRQPELAALIRQMTAQVAEVQRQEQAEER